MTSTMLLIMLIGIGAFDLYLYFTAQKTLSQGWLFDRLGIKIDPPSKAVKAGILIGLMILVWVLGGVSLFVRVLIGVIFGHLLWQE